VLLVTLCLAVGVSGGGCSFIFVDGPPTQHKKMPYFDCTSSNVLPVVDSVIGGIYGIAAASELANHDQYSSTSTSENLGMLGFAALFAASGIYGFGKTSSCREAKAELVERASQQPSGFGASSFAPTSPPPGYGAPAPGQMPAPYDPWLGPPAVAAPPDAPPPGAAGAPAPKVPPTPPQPVDPASPAQP
jgi:hypothetical protein